MAVLGAASFLPGVFVASVVFGVVLLLLLLGEAVVNRRFDRCFRVILYASPIAAAASLVWWLHASGVSLSEADGLIAVWLWIVAVTAGVFARARLSSGWAIPPVEPA